MNDAPMEHEFEAQHGLPEALPAGERILWQGTPDFRAMALRCFHLRTLAIYFAVILCARAATVSVQGGSVADAAIAALWLAPGAGLALGVLALMAWLSCRSTVYTITDRRVVMRIGIVLTVTFNLPFTRIEAAAVSQARDGTGDIALTTADGDRIAYLHLWPHARPWRLRKTEPSLRCLRNPSAVGQVLTAAWRAVRTDGAPAPEVASPLPATTPARMPAARRRDAATTGTGASTGAPVSAH